MTVKVNWRMSWNVKIVTFLCDWDLPNLSWFSQGKSQCNHRKSVWCMKYVFDVLFLVHKKLTLWWCLMTLWSWLLLWVWGFDNQFPECRACRLLHLVATGAGIWADLPQYLGLERLLVCQVWTLRQFLCVILIFFFNKKIDQNEFALVPIHDI